MPLTTRGESTPHESRNDPRPDSGGLIWRFERVRGTFPTGWWRESLRDSLHRLSWGGETPPPRRCAPRMDAFRVSPHAVNSLWWNPGERRERPVLPVGARRPADKAREGGIPGVFRPKRNAERSEAEWFSRDASPLEPPPGELGRLGFTTGCYTPAAPNSSSTRSGRSGSLRNRTPVASWIAFATAAGTGRCEGSPAP